MRHSSKVVLTLLALGLNLGAVSCAGLSRGLEPRDGRETRTSESARKSTAVLSSPEQKALKLQEAGDDHALIAFVDELEAGPRYDALTPESRGHLELMRARALVRMDRDLSALTAFGGAWQEVQPNADGVGGVILQEWANHEMALGEYRPAAMHYEAALGAKDLTPAQVRDLRCSLVVACEASGMSSKASEQLALLDRSGRSRLGVTRAQLLQKGKGPTAAAPPVADAMIPKGVIPMNPALILPGIRGRDEWGARPIGSNHDPMTPMSSITVHHTAMPPPGKYGTIAQLKQIQDIHTQDKGWADVGYHFLIDPNGVVWEGRRLMYQGAHAGGAANIGNVGVCLMGNFDNSRVPKAQMQALSDLVAALRNQFNVPRNEIRTHREWKATACPGQYLHAAVVDYRSDPIATLALQ
jgi:hypothetical protein